MQKTPSDKMIKDTPRKKALKKKKVKKEPVAEVVETKELSTKQKKDVQHIQKIIVHDTGNPFDKLSRAQIDLIKTQVAKGATDNELDLFITVCRNSKLDPFMKQVHFVKRWDSKRGQEVGTIQVGIDGFRSIAEMSERYAGSDDAVYRDEHEETLDKQVCKIPGSATVTVYKLMDNGERYAFTATARWSEYYPGDRQGYMWRKMPFAQLGKCAEALALRKAFPKLLSGLYAPEEMDQAHSDQGEPENAFEKAKRLLAMIKSPDSLVEAKIKLTKSSKYTKEQKKKLSEAIDKRIEELTQKNDNA